MKKGTPIVHTKAHNPSMVPVRSTTRTELTGRGAMGPSKPATVSVKYPDTSKGRAATRASRNRS